MKNLWIAFIVIATLGSIYPFDFQLSALDSETLRVFFGTCCRLPGRGDLVGNIILFLPFGFTGLLALQLARAPVRGIVVVCMLGAIFALALQVLQFFLPTRDENLQDVVWNVVGTAGGALLAVLFRRYTSALSVEMSNAVLAPLALIATWLIYKTLPFVPSIDLQSIKDSLKPLFYGELGIVATFADLSAWLVVGCLLRRAQPGARLDRYLPALIAAVLGLEVLIVTNAIDRADVVGAGLAALLWGPWLARVRYGEPVVLAGLVAALALGGLAPFALRAFPADFHWLPFHGFLSGSMYVNAQSAAEKVFLYGSLVYLLERLSNNRYRSLALAFGFVALIEVAQVLLAGHTPETTDPLLVLLAALALFSLELREPGQAHGSPAPDPPRRGGGKPLKVIHGDRTGTFAGQWRCKRINLRSEHYLLLRQLSREMNVSVSGVARIVIQRFIDASADEPGGLPATLRSLHAARDYDTRNGTDSWVNQSVNLHGNQLEFLAAVGAETGMSVSATARSIIVHFIRALPDEETIAADSRR